MRTYLTTRESAVRLNFGAGANVQDPNSGVRIAWVGRDLGVSESRRGPFITW